MRPSTAALADAFHAALNAAEAYVGATAPNPPVGCVALDADGLVLACEAHQKAGAAHAEAAVIAACGRRGLNQRIHTLIVTLEPCNHAGRTPPCVEAILATPAKSVWIGARDPNPRVAGGGAGRLAAAGLEISFWHELDHSDASGLKQRADRLVAPFATWCALGRPWLTVKQAIAAGGGMIPPGGRGTFTSQSSLVLAHRLRRRADAIITGSGCILVDDPAFTVRHIADHAGKHRKLAILDRRRRTPRSYVEAAKARGFDVVIGSDLRGLLRELADAGVIEALVEAGPTVLAAFLEHDLWDEHVVIRQSPIPGDQDTVDVRARPAF
ncbi:MAG: bifunctional diaminohydroxyphosphoribosylaminopyrimidine deaminase/5-amino-6-(5-phosphoribosylamino)uracil reductase RibD [Caulobacteraceae bacterium]|nr:bifunctional diaminohydroxyphosphoribosylaminopyrimidine deaminase/5-amino-6-(5-phosphoribosylamino)uracil reductase RibD [Caulobacteraceae bacterium]